MGNSKHPALDLRFAPGPGAGALQDSLYAELDAFEPIAIQEHEAGDGWRVFFQTRARREAARSALLSEFRYGLLDLSRVDVDDEDWARRSQSDLKAVRAGRIIVAPPWDIPMIGSPVRPPVPGRTTGPAASWLPHVVIVIEPSMGFGTGHHATTRLCLELLQQVDVIGRHVIDVGTGSGVLAIAAAKLGAASVLAVDNDPDALRNARENLVRNQASAIDVREADVAALVAEPADVILANLTAAVLVRVAAPLMRLMTPGATVIVSGFGPDELMEVTAAFGARIAAEAHDGEWAAASLQI